MKFEIVKMQSYNEDYSPFTVYYIISNDGGYYLHKNGACYVDCFGPNKMVTTLNNLTDYVKFGGYYETKKEAQKVLDEYNKKNKPKLTLEERVEALEKKLGNANI